MRFMSALSILIHPRFFGMFSNNFEFWTKETHLNLTWALQQRAFKFRFLLQFQPKLPDFRLPNAPFRCCLLSVVWWSIQNVHTVGVRVFLVCYSYNSNCWVARRGVIHSIREILDYMWKHLEDKLLQPVHFNRRLGLNRLNLHTPSRVLYISEVYTQFWTSPALFVVRLRSDLQLKRANFNFNLDALSPITV